MEISKLDAAKRQLDIAINLFFKQSDPVSIHTLTAAVHQLLMDIGRLGNIKSIMKESPLIKKEYLKEYLTKINEAENFFKHADKDPDALLKFNPEQTEFLLFDAVEMYMQLTGEMPEDMSIFRFWFLIKYPNVVNPNIQDQLIERRLDINTFRAKSKTEFYSSMKNALIYSNL
jgi:hypothetical protein